MLLSTCMPHAACRLCCPLLHRLAYRLFHKRTALLAVHYAARLGPGPVSPAAAAAGPGRPTTAAAATGDPAGSGAGGGGKGSGTGAAGGIGQGAQAAQPAGRTDRPAGREAAGRVRRVNAVEAELQEVDSSGGDGGGFVDDAWTSDGDDGEWLAEAAGAGGGCVHSDAADKAAVRGGGVGAGSGADGELRRDVRHALQLSQVHAPAWLASLAFALHPVHTEVS